MELAFALQENPCRLSGVGTQCAHASPPASCVVTGSPTRGPLGSVGLQPTKNLHRADLLPAFLLLD